MTALIGAIPVPGPTQMMGVDESLGSLRRPFCMPIESLSPAEGQYMAEPMSRRNIPTAKPERYDVQTPRRGTFSLVR